MSANKIEIGEVSQKGDGVIEWSIDDIFLYTKEDVGYVSPTFSVSGWKWYLKINPNGETRSSSVGWISLFLWKKDRTAPPVGVNMKLGVKTVFGTHERQKDLNYYFNRDNNGFGTPGLLQRSELLCRRSQLAPSDTLTLTCNLMVMKTADASSRLDVLSQNFDDMFISKRNCDATLKVKDERFSVHRCILSARSPVFNSIFEIDMKEKETGEVEISDCDPGPFREFLRYLYSGKAENLSSNGIELYKIADKYSVKELRDDCAVSIMADLSVGNVLDAYALGNQFEEEGLQCRAQKFFNENFGKIILTENWKTFLEVKPFLVNELLQNMAQAKKL